MQAKTRSVARLYKQRTDLLPSRVNKLPETGWSVNRLLLKTDNAIRELGIVEQEICESDAVTARCILKTLCYACHYSRHCIRYCFLRVHCYLK